MSLQSITLAGIDARWIAQTFAFRRELSTPEPVTDSWLQRGQAYGTVLRDGQGQWRMWYLDDPVYTEHFATSRDGLRWDTPSLNLGLSSLKAGAVLPNAIMTSPQQDAAGRWLSGSQGPEGFCVLDRTLTPHPAGHTRFTVLYLARWQDAAGKSVSGLCLAHSDDGIHWLAGEHNPVLDGWMDTGNVFFYDQRHRKYVIYGRPNAFVDRVTHANRLVGRSESEDLQHWTPYRTVLDTDDLDADPQTFLDEAALRAGGNLTQAQQAAIWQAVTEGATKAEKAMIRGRNRQWYGLTVFPYHDLYLGVGMMYDIPSGHIWLELLHSYDGLDWRRELVRRPWLPFHAGRWDYPCQIPAASPPVRVGDEDWFYYSATRKHHHGTSNEISAGIGLGREPLRVIGACRLQRDRWAGYSAGNGTAEMLTQPLPGPLTAVRLNARVAQGGELRLELCDRNGRGLPGFSLNDCRPMVGDKLDHLPDWIGTTTGAPLPEQVWRLRITGRQATVFALTIAFVPELG